MSFMFVCVNFRELAEIGIFVDIWICVFDTCSKWLLVVNDSFLVVSSPRAFIDPAIVLSTFMLPFSFVIVCDLIEQKRNVQVLLIYFLNIYMHWGWRYSKHKWKIGIALTGLSTSLLCVFLKPRLGFPTSNVVSFCVPWVKVRGNCSLCLLTT
jgi:hypothetical protein